MQIVPEINLQEIIDYGKQKNVGVWLWGVAYRLIKKLMRLYQNIQRWA